MLHLLLYYSHVGCCLYFGMIQYVCLRYAVKCCSRHHCSVHRNIPNQLRDLINSKTITTRENDHKERRGQRPWYICICLWYTCTPYKDGHLSAVVGSTATYGSILQCKPHHEQPRMNAATSVDSCSIAQPPPSPAVFSINFQFSTCQSMLSFVGGRQHIILACDRRRKRASKERKTAPPWHDYAHGDSEYYTPSWRETTQQASRMRHDVIPCGADGLSFFTVRHTQGVSLKV